MVSRDNLKVLYLGVFFQYFITLGYCHGASCLQANNAEGRKDDRLKKERKEKKGRNLTKVNRYL